MSPVVVTTAGPAARAAVLEAVGAARACDPLAAVTVTVPSVYAGLSLRRELAAGAGCANVRFLSLAQVAGLLATPDLAVRGKRPLTEAVATEAARATLEQASDAWSPGADHPAVWRSLGRVLTASRPAPLDREARAWLLRFRAITAGYHDERERFEAATRAVQGDDPASVGIGSLIVFAPPHLAAEAVSFLRAGARAAKVRVILALTGDPDVDRGVLDVASALDPARERACSASASGAEPHTAPRSRDLLVSCPDPGEEAREAVRIVVGELDAGTPLPRIAITFADAERYARLLHAELHTAEIPWNGPSPRRLSSTTPGRVVLALLALHERGLRRDDVLAFLTDTEVRARRGSARPAPGLAWARLARQHPVTRGLGGWERGLGRDPSPSAADLLRFVRELAVLCEPPRTATWSHRCRWALTLVERYLGADTDPARPEADQRALTAIRARLTALGELDALGTHPPHAAFAAAVEHELRAPLGPIARFGDGVLVAPFGALAGTDFDVVVMVGMSEGAGSGTRDPHTLGLPAGRFAPPAGADARRPVRDALAAGRRRVLTFPRADTQAHRALRPGPVVLELAAALAGRPVAARELDEPAPAAAWRRVVASAAAAVDGPFAGNARDHDLASLLHWRAARLDPADHPLVAADPVLAAGVSSRSRGHGDPSATPAATPAALGTTPDTADAALTPTALATWARCPMQYFLGRVLRMRDSRPEPDPALLSPGDRGTVVHEALARFMGSHQGRHPDHRWTAGERAALADIVRDASTCRGAGSFDRLALSAELDRVLDTDEALRADRRLITEAVEVGFGEDGPLPPVVIDADGVPVEITGRIDRVDRRVDGSALELFDYKTGDAISARGELEQSTRLQLGVYALAVSAANPGIPVRASAWMTGRHPGGVVGFDLVDERDAVENDIRTIVRGIRAAHFPAVPGAVGRFGPANCARCPYDRVCPLDRVDRWERRATPLSAGAR